MAHDKKGTFYTVGKSSTRAAWACVSPELLRGARGKGKLLMHRSTSRQKFRTTGVNLSDGQIPEWKE